MRLFTVFTTWVLGILLVISSCQTNTNGSNDATTWVNQLEAEGYTLTETTNNTYYAVKKDKQDHILEEGYVNSHGKVGNWVSYHPRNGFIKTITPYINNNISGQVIKVNDRNQVEEKAAFVNNDLNGPRFRYNNSRVKEEANYTNGKLNGRRVLYYDDGKNIQEEGNFVNGERDGLNKWFNKEGEVTIEYNYKNGKKVE